MAYKHRVCDPCATSVRIGTRELPLVGKTSEGRVCASDIAAWVAKVTDKSGIRSNHLHLLDPSVRRDRLREGKAANGDLEDGHHAERHGRGGFPNVVFWKEEERCKALSQQGFKVFANSEQVKIPVRNG